MKHTLILLEPIGANVIAHCSCGWRSHLSINEHHARTQHTPLIRSEDKAQTKKLKSLAKSQPEIKKRESGATGTPIQHQVFVELRAKGLAHLIPQVKEQNESTNHSTSV